ncbi:MAG: hypothetical protein NTZ10_00270 [Candidatus Saganbacteria bacterium]|nr:hypothetical protein [Candidatus Saganbacteria bacterium]
MQDDIKIPKEQFLVDYFKTKTQASKPEDKPFNEVLQTIQVRIEKKSLESLQNSPKEEADRAIDSLDPKEAVSLLKETINTLRSISG